MVFPCNHFIRKHIFKWFWKNTVASKFLFSLGLTKIDMLTLWSFKVYQICSRTDFATCVSVFSWGPQSFMTSCASYSTWRRQLPDTCLLKGISLDSWGTPSKDEECSSTFTQIFKQTRAFPKTWHYTTWSFENGLFFCFIESQPNWWEKKLPWS